MLKFAASHAANHAAITAATTMIGRIIHLNISVRLAVTRLVSGSLRTVRTGQVADPRTRSAVLQARADPSRTAGAFPSREHRRRHKRPVDGTAVLGPPPPPHRRRSPTPRHSQGRIGQHHRDGVQLGVHRVQASEHRVDRLADEMRPVRIAAASGLASQRQSSVSIGGLPVASE
jgi:hypothetical protein